MVTSGIWCCQKCDTCRLCIDYTGLRVRSGGVVPGAALLLRLRSGLVWEI
jgi:hypothetical protein